MHRVHGLLNSLRLETVIRPTKACDLFYDTLNICYLYVLVRVADAVAGGFFLRYLFSEERGVHAVLTLTFRHIL